MATYKEIRERVKISAGFVPKTCWIADVKAQHGLTTREAPNRESSAYRVHPCPPKKKGAIEAAFRHFGMIK